ncbi:hypothetical protein ABZP36_032242 [Zizania latifolia]
MTPLLAAFACLFLDVFPPVDSGDAKTLESVPDLVKAMHVNVESFLCLRLLNRYDPIGCCIPCICCTDLAGHDKIVAPIVRMVSNDLKRSHKLADKNEKTTNGYLTNVAEFDLVIQDLPSGT